MTAIVVALLSHISSSLGIRTALLVMPSPLQVVTSLAITPPIAVATLTFPVVALAAVGRRSNASTLALCRRVMGGRGGVEVFAHLLAIVEIQHAPVWVGMSPGGRNKKMGGFVDQAIEIGLVPAAGADRVKCGVWGRGKGSCLVDLVELRDVAKAEDVEHCWTARFKVRLRFLMIEE